MCIYSFYPVIACHYLKFAAGIDIHNLIRTGSVGFEDIWKTKEYHHRQFAGLIGFLLTNAFQAYKYFGKNDLKTHTEFKMKLANQMTNYQDFDSVVLRKTIPSVTGSVDAIDHDVRSFAQYGEKFQKRCWYCRNGYEQRRNETKTSFYCGKCGIQKPICSPAARSDCWDLHLLHGMPSRRKRQSTKK